MKLQKYGLGHHWLTGFRMGKLVPMFMQEVSAGEIFKGSSNAVFRLAPMDFPKFMQFKLHAHVFYVPYRLLWDEFPEVFTGEDTSTAWPTITYAHINTIWSYFGIKSTSLVTPELSALPIRAFNKIWNEHFRNPLLQAERSEDTVTGSLPLVHHSSNEYFGRIQTELAQGGSTSEKVTVTTGEWDVVDYRDAMNRQRYKERRALYGERYEDVLRAEHGIDISEVRLSKPEHCASAISTMGISEVVATATSATEETGEYRGHGITGMSLRFPARKFPEPGMLMGVIYARPRLQLENRIDKIFLTQDHEDLYHPHLNTDTQQIVKSDEIYHNVAGAPTNFGYLGKYDHLRFARDTVAGFPETYDYALVKELSAVPTVTYLQQVQETDEPFQDQTTGRADVRAFFDHRISKLSPIPRRKK